MEKPGVISLPAWTRGARQERAEPREKRGRRIFPVSGGDVAKARALAAGRRPDEADSSPVDRARADAAASVQDGREDVGGRGGRGAGTGGRMAQQRMRRLASGGGCARSCHSRSSGLWRRPAPEGGRPRRGAASARRVVAAGLRERERTSCASCATILGGERRSLGGV